MCHVFFSEQDRQVLLRLLGALTVQYVDAVNAYEREKHACPRCIIDCDCCPDPLSCPVPLDRLADVDRLADDVRESDARLVALSHALSELSGYDVVFSDTAEYVRSLDHVR